MADAVPGTPATGVDALIDAAGTSILQWPPRYIEGQDKITHAFLNWGVNEMGGGVDEPANLPDAATWKGDYQSIITYVHGRFPGVVMHLSYPWRVGYDLQAAEMHERVDDVITWCATQGIACVPGVDEAVTIKADDNGLAETDSGGVHYTALGNELYATEMANRAN